MALRIEHDGTRATGVRVRGVDGEERTEAADFVVLAAGAIESSRFALISEVPDPGGYVGRGLMFHWFTDGFGIWLDQRIHANRGRDTSHCVDDFCDPDFPGAREAAQAAGLPYFRGGVLELGGTTHPIDEALQYIELMELFDADKPFGHRFKELMRLSALRDRLAGVQMIAEDLAQATNRVDLDPSVTDRYGLPVARITYLPHQHELAAQDFYTPLLSDMIKAAGAAVSGAVAQTGTKDEPSATGEFVPSGAHIMGGLRMGADQATSATDQFGRLWGLENVGVADSAVFPTSGAHNPTLTIMTTAMRNARAWAGVEGNPEIVVPTSAAGEEAAPSSEDGDDDGGVPTAVVVGGVAAVAVAGGAAAVAARRKHTATEPE
jgi:gluconate 2-dehydrogenase alpha chain